MALPVTQPLPHVTNNSTRQKSVLSHPKTLPVKEISNRLCTHPAFPIHEVLTVSVGN